MSSERRLLIDMCLGTAGPDSLKGADTAALLGWAERLKVETYLLYQLGAAQASLGPERGRWMASLRDRVSESAVANLRRDEATREILSRFTDHGVHVLLLKGAALRLQRSGLAGRFQNDVDLLVRIEDLEKAESVLKASGYTFDASHHSRESYRRSHFHLPYLRDGILIELHWDLDVHAPAGFVERVWQKSRTLQPGEETWRVPALEHQILFNCLHLSRHAFLRGLRWLADLSLDLPLSDETRRSFEREARFWQPRTVYAPLWLLADRGVSWGGLSSDAATDAIDANPLERLLLKSLAFHLILGEPWLHLPLGLTKKIVLGWLYSQESLARLLPGTLTNALVRRVRAASSL